jgi:hypothetical protein
MNRACSAFLPLLLVLATMFPASVHANCGAEGCPLVPRGPEATVGRFSFSFGYQAVEQDRHWDGTHEITAAQALQADGGLGHVLEQYTRTRTTLLNADARLARRLSLALSLPWVDRIHRHALAHHANFFIDSEWHMQGPGDATALADWTVLDGARPGLGVLTLQLGAKLPTGETSVAAVNGETPEASARPGSGSTDALVGLHYRRSLPVRAWGGRPASVPVTASVRMRYNGKGTEDYRMGNEWNASVGAGYPLAHGVRLLAQLDASQHARDDAGLTDAEPHSTGSSSLFASPGVLVQIVPGMSAFGYYQFRLYEHSNGPQLVSPYHLNLGLAYTVR